MMESGNQKLRSNSNIKLNIFVSDQAKQFPKLFSFPLYTKLEIAFVGSSVPAKLYKMYMCVVFGTL